MFYRSQTSGSSLMKAIPVLQQQANPSNTLTIFTDGACAGNPGPGGWAARLLYGDGRVLELGGFAPQTTNNRMELQAAIEGLRAAASPGPMGATAGCAIVLITDSQYLRQGITAWIRGWKKRGWRTAAKKPVLNQDLWCALDRLNTPAVQWRHTQGHAGDPNNERCDQLAKAFSRGETPSLRRD